jgi:hypothetical protein
VHFLASFPTHLDLLDHASSNEGGVRGRGRGGGQRLVLHVASGSALPSETIRCTTEGRSRLSEKRNTGQQVCHISVSFSALLFKGWSVLIMIMITPLPHLHVPHWSHVRCSLRGILEGFTPGSTPLLHLAIPTCQGHPYPLTPTCMRLKILMDALLGFTLRVGGTREGLASQCRVCCAVLLLLLH